MLLYHGSKNIVEKPIFGVGSRYNDYGQGFYCTENQELAKEWACQERNGGYCNQYELDVSELSILNLNSESYHILNWVALLIQNRMFSKKTINAKNSETYILQNFLPDISGADIVQGYRADDSYFAFARDFLNNAITVHQLSEAMRLGELGEQIVLKSKKAFNAIQFVKADPVEYCIYGPRREERDNKARNTYINSHGTDFEITPDDLYMADIIRRRLTNDDKSLFRSLSR